MNKLLTIGETEAISSNTRTGQFAHDTQTSKESVRALRFATFVWGAATPWTDITEAHWYELLRRRLEALVNNGDEGVRATDITVGSLRTTVGWLRKRKHIPPKAAQWPSPKEWRAEIDRHWQRLHGGTRERVDKRLEHTQEEARAIMGASKLDARLELLMWLGADVSAGQVSRARRSDLELPPAGSREFGTLNVLGSGRRQISPIQLDAGQRRVLDRMLGVGGYLHKFEREWEKSRIDYLLFPSGYMVNRVAASRNKPAPPQYLSPKAKLKRHVGASWIRKNFREAEKAAGVRHIKGRGIEGLRRLSDSASLDRIKRQAVRGELVSAPTLSTVTAVDAPPDFSPLTADAGMNGILQRRWIECVKCVSVKADLAAIVMMGGLLEALLVARAELLQDKAPLFTSKSSPKDTRTGNPLPLGKWTLAPYIDVAHELGWITKSAKDVAVVLRDYRNYVHPAKEQAHGVSLQADDSHIFWDLTKKLSSQLLKSATSSR